MASKSVRGAGLRPRRVGAAPKCQAANFIPFPLEKKKNILMAAAEPRWHAVPPAGKSSRAAAAAVFVSKTGASGSAA